MRGLVCAGLLLLAGRGTGAAGARPLGGAPKTNEPIATIPLEPLGFLAPSARQLAEGGNLFTLHFVDETHLLFTYYTRGLMPRLPDATPEDNDGLVAAVLLEVPSGKVLAKTEWRMRDRDPYLWALGHGRFLLRVRTRLVLLNPLTNLKAGEAFKEEPFVDLRRRIGYITVSPGGDLLSIETVPPKAKADAAQGEAASGAGLRPKVEIHFYRLELVEARTGEGEHLLRKAAGALGAPELVSIPATAEGFLSISKESDGVYLFDFLSHLDKKKIELSPMETTCSPRPVFVSRSEFVAFGCRGGTDRTELGEFNLHGEHAWIEVLSGNQLPPQIVPSPRAGRFAMSRTLIASTAIDPYNVMPTDLSTQEITVRQTYDGRLLLKVLADPVQRGAQNFDMGPDGMTLAVVHAGAIAVYRLQGLSGKDEKQLKLATADEPARNVAMILLNSMPIAVGAQGGSSAGAGAETPAPVEDSAAGAPGAAAVSGGAPAAGETGNTVGDVPAGARRTPPTLYGPDHPKPQ